MAECNVDLQLFFARFLVLLVKKKEDFYFKVERKEVGEEKKGGRERERGRERQRERGAGERKDRGSCHFVPSSLSQ